MVKMKKFIYIGLLLGSLLTLNGYGQLSIQFNAFTNGTHVNRLANVVLNNRFSTDMGCKVTIIVREARQGQVLRLSTPVFRLNRGANTISPDVFNKSIFGFASTDAGRALAQTRLFADGEYEYCFEVNLYPDKANTISTDYYEACFNQTIQRTLPLTLVNPYDGEISCNQRPDFLWQPAIPFQPGLTYTLVLVEVKTRQSRAEAIAFNQPLLFQSGIAGSRLAFPVLAKQLEEGKTYAWQVLATQSKLVVSRSEIWLYKVQCTQEEPVNSNDGYRELKDNRDEGSYEAGNWLRFAFYNSYGESDLVYSITDLSQKEKSIKILPKLLLRAGYNKYALYLGDINGMIADHQYLLTVTAPNGKKMYLGFIYREGGKEND